MNSLDQPHHHISTLEPLAPVAVSFDKSLGLTCGSELRARTDCPTVDSSLKDSFAATSSDIADASPDHPVSLTVAGALTAGDDTDRLCVASETVAHSDRYCRTSRCVS